MKKWFKDWSPLPADMLIQVLLPVILIVVGMLASILLPLLQHVRRADAWSLFGVAIAAHFGKHFPVHQVVHLFETFPRYHRAIVVSPPYYLGHQA